MAPNPLRNIPSVNELLENPALKGLMDRISHNVVVHSVRTVLDEVRHEVHSATAERALPSVSELADRIARRVLEGEPSILRPVINATGVLLPGGLGRAPLSDEAVSAMAAVAGDYANVELDLATGKHQRRMHALEEMLRHLTGAEGALVVNNTAGAVMATLAALASGREVVVSRGHMAEIGCSYRLPDVIAAAGAIAREVGTVNKTHASDYAAAIGDSTAALLLVRPTNYQVGGAASVGEVIEVGHRHRVPVIHCVGYGSLLDLAPFGLADEPVVSKCIAAGTDLVLFSGDKLVGGPPVRHPRWPASTHRQDPEAPLGTSHSHQLTNVSRPGRHARPSSRSGRKRCRRYRYCSSWPRHSTTSETELRGLRLRFRRRSPSERPR